MLKEHRCIKITNADSGVSHSNFMRVNTIINTGMSSNNPKNSNFRSKRDGREASTNFLELMIGFPFIILCVQYSCLNIYKC